ncbi:DNA-directed RNA polymerase subunit omega [Desulfitobacterium sp.]|uniref:DNA-directed RNA polymerase subunit omega n=1 Tax=Desulfitobacterium sp. TaxID=49981 RepID=UPI002B211A5B|nr:DNA-directed RNA polymerase subunit omega [Desulfitobacterium sp.]MEA4900109.1 DNA-directed RNA polymerase subunit omega [Desulfitobacterium sp.]
MRQPSLDYLMTKVDSKYTLVLAAAKRARTLMEDPEFEANAHGAKPVSIALEEIANGRFHFELTNEGIK